MTACVGIRGEYNRCFSIAIALAVAVHIVAFAFWPEYVPKAYKPRIVIPRIVDLEYDVEIPPKPQEIDLPKIPVDIEPSDDADSDETIAETIFNPREHIVKPPGVPEQPRWFIAFETPPKLYQRVAPRYPEIARKAEVEGTVIVLATIDDDGRVIDAWIGKSDAEVLDEAAIQAAYEFEFEPALQRDVPVKATIRLTFEFRLTD